jgi:serine/threonine protein kinase
MYFMLAGRPPFRANNAMGVLNRICTETHRPIDQVNPDVPNEVVELIERLMSKPAAQRFQSMHQIEAELEHLLAALQSGGLSLSKRKPKPAKTFNAKSQFAAVKKFAAQHRIALAAFTTIVIAATAWFALWPRNNGNEMTAGQLRKLEAAKANWNMHIREDQQFLQDVTRANELARQIAGPLVSNSFSSSDQFEASMKSLQSQIEQYESQFSNSTMGQE